MEVIKTIFCCCASRHDYDDSDDEGIETPMSNVNLCQAGLTSGDLKAEEKGGVYTTSGKGVLIGSCALECDTAYWEVVVGKDAANLKIGVVRFDSKTQKKAPNLDKDAWALDKETLKEGDVIGVHWDQTDLPMLSFTKNGERCVSSVNRIRPSNNIYAAVEATSAKVTCQVVFDGRHFKSKPLASKFSAIVCATSII